MLYDMLFNTSYSNHTKGMTCAGPSMACPVTASAATASYTLQIYLTYSFYCHSDVGPSNPKVSHAEDKISQQGYS